MPMDTITEPPEAINPCIVQTLPAGELIHYHGWCFRLEKDAEIYGHPLSKVYASDAVGAASRNRNPSLLAHLRRF